MLHRVHSRNSSANYSRHTRTHADPVNAASSFTRAPESLVYANHSAGVAGETALSYPGEPNAALTIGSSLHRQASSSDHLV